MKQSKAKTTSKATSARATSVPAKAAPPPKKHASAPTSRNSPPPASKPAKAAPKGSTAPPAAASKAPKAPKAAKGKDVPQFFRVNLEVGDIDAAERFYERLLGVGGRKQPGSRVYFTAGAVTLQIVDVSASGKPHPNSKSLYFLVRDLDPLYERAKALGCLSREMVHGQPGGEIRVRPWGERSFYVQDRWKNPLCFVQADTAYTGG